MYSATSSMIPKKIADARQHLDEDPCLRAQSAEQHVVEHRRTGADHDRAGQLLASVPVDRVEQRPPAKLGIEAVCGRHHLARLHILRSVLDVLARQS